MSRFFVDAGDVGESTIMIHDQKDLRHMRKVLRLRPGDRIEISDSARWEYEVELLSIDQEMAEARILDKQRFAREPHLQVTLFQGIPKQSKMETIVQKCVELGAVGIVPVFMERTVVADKGNMEKKRARWQKIAAEAAKQCRRGIIPRIAQPLAGERLPEALCGFDLVIFPYENETGTTMKTALRSRKDIGQTGKAGAADGPRTAALIIGPEGGFSHREAERIKAAGACCVSLGRTVLRTETAGPAALAMLMYELEL